MKTIMVSMIVFLFMIFGCGKNNEFEKEVTKKITKVQNAYDNAYDKALEIARNSEKIVGNVVKKFKKPSPTEIVEEYFDKLRKGEYTLNLFASVEEYDLYLYWENNLPPSNTYRPIMIEGSNYVLEHSKNIKEIKEVEKVDYQDYKGDLEPLRKDQIITEMFKNKTLGKDQIITKMFKKKTSDIVMVSAKSLSQSQRERNLWFMLIKPKKEWKIILIDDF